MNTDNNHDEDRFKFSYIILSLCLITFGSAFTYIMGSLWLLSEFNLLFLVYIPTILLAGIAPIVVGFLCACEQIKKLFHKNTMEG